VPVCFELAVSRRECFADTGLDPEFECFSVLVLKDAEAGSGVDLGQYFNISPPILSTAGKAMPS
jgi:hypothetical protein